MREQVDRRAAEQRRGGDELQRLVGVAERLLHPERDAARCRRPSRSAGRSRSRAPISLRSLPRRGVRQPARRDQRDDVEVQPPLRARRRRRRARRRRPRRRSRRASAPTPIATIDSPSAMITISPWRSAKCSGIMPPAARVDHQRAADVEHQRERPQRALQRRRRRTRRRAAGRRRCRADHEPDRRVAQARVVAAGDDEQHDLHAAHEPVGDREQQRLVAERVRHAQRDDEQPGHRA